MDAIGSVKVIQTPPAGLPLKAEVSVNSEPSVKDEVSINQSPRHYTSEEIKEKLCTVAEGAHITGEIAHSAEAAGLLGSITAVGGIAGGLFLGINGIRDMKHALKDKSVEHIAEAAGGIALGGESLGEAAILASKTAVGSSIMGPLASSIVHSGALEKALGVFGLVHVGIEGVFAGREVYKGIKSKDKNKIISGAINLGMSLAVAGVILGAGLPAGIALGALFAGKVIHNRKQIKADVMHIFEATKNRVKRAFS